MWVYEEMKMCDKSSDLSLKTFHETCQPSVQPEIINMDQQYV